MSGGGYSFVAQGDGTVSVTGYEGVESDGVCLHLDIPDAIDSASLTLATAVDTQVADAPTASALLTLSGDPEVTADVTGVTVGNVKVTLNI